MKIEHVAVNVADPVKMAKWYVEHLGMTIVRSMDEAPFAHFLADDSGNVMIEIYCNPPDLIPDYKAMHHLVLHLAFLSEDPAGDRQRLEQAGATFVEEIKPGEGGHIIMLRDPWGLAIQFCKRARPMLRG